MGTFIDESGKQYGKWFVIKRDPDSIGKAARFICQCECGTIKSILGRELRNGRTKSCGCANKVEWIGRKFTKLTVISIDPENSQKVICKCDCGETVSVWKGHLVSGKTKSCGKHQSEIREINNTSSLIDLTGKKFGMLTVDSINRDYNKKAIYWNCTCDCGNKKIILGQHLKQGNIISCGCFKQSKGEYKIKNLLTENHISFETESTMPDLLSDKGKKLRFDFKVKKDNDKFYFIEFDGRQHFTDENPWNSNDSLEHRQFLDNLKNNYCLNNDIPLIRIPYTHLKNIKLEDLLLETSSFLVSSKGGE